MLQKISFLLSSAKIQCKRRYCYCYWFASGYPYFWLLQKVKRRDLSVANGYTLTPLAVLAKCNDGKSVLNVA